MSTTKEATSNLDTIAHEAEASHLAMVDQEIAASTASVLAARPQCRTTIAGAIEIVKTATAIEVEIPPREVVQGEDSPAETVTPVAQKVISRDSAPQMRRVTRPMVRVAPLLIVASHTSELAETQQTMVVTREPRAKEEFLLLTTPSRVLTVLSLQTAATSLLIMQATSTVCLFTGDLPSRSAIGTRARVVASVGVELVALRKTQSEG